MADAQSNLWGPMEQLSAFQGAQLVSCSVAIIGLLEMATVRKQWCLFSRAPREIQQQWSMPLAVSGLRKGETRGQRQKMTLNSL